MYIPLVTFILAVAAFFFFVVAVDPKSKYAFIAVLFVLLTIGSVFWPDVAPAMAVR